MNFLLQKFLFCQEFINHCLKHNLRVVFPCEIFQWWILHGKVETGKHCLSFPIVWFCFKVISILVLGKKPPVNFHHHFFQQDLRLKKGLLENVCRRRLIFQWVSIHRSIMKGLPVSFLSTNHSCSGFSSKKVKIRADGFFPRILVLR